jgi:CSLREA domain-containing protein
MSTRQRAQSAITDETKKEGSTAMTVESSKEGFAWSKKTRALAAGLLVAGMMAAVSLMPAPAADAATTFTVNLTADTPDANLSNAACDVNPTASGKQCTLRAAIQQANATAGADTIRFAIPGTTGVKTITPASILPVITEQVTIDGYTQTGAHPNTKAIGNDVALKIQLNGTNVPGGNGLEISNSSSSVIKGLAINRFGLAGIAVGGDSGANRIEGNFIGTNPSGTLDRGNGTDAVAIFDGPSETVVGGTTVASRNVLSGNGDTGVFLVNSNANRIQGNYVGTDKSGTKDLGNEDGGLFINNAQDTIVGGNTVASRNVVSGNGFDGISIVGTSSRNRVVGNFIGTTASGTGALGNDLEGLIIGSSQNFVGDGTSTGSNTVAFNGGDGINVSGGSANRIDHNSIFSNAAIGIDLSGGVEDAAGRTANDTGDADTGSNGLQNFPVITSAKTVSGKTTIEGTLNTLPNPNADVGYDVQFFSNPSGGDEGKTFIGSAQVTPDASGNATFTFSPSSTVAVGRTITATAQSSSPIALDDGNTSEFSAPRTVASS